MRYSARLMSESGLVSRVSPVQTALRSCTRDEGRSFEVGNQVLISSHRKLPRRSNSVREARRARGAPYHIEGGKAQTSKVVKFQLRPDPLAR